MRPLREGRRHLRRVREVSGRQTRGALGVAAAVARLLLAGLGLIWAGLDWLRGELVDMIRYERDRWKRRR
jgi:hypothetical protein